VYQWPWRCTSIETYVDVVLQGST